MIQRLLDVLRIVAADAEAQATRHASWTCRPDRLGPELADVLLLVDSCQQESMTAPQREPLEALELDLERLGSDVDFWSAQAVRADPRWDELRRLARDALRALGQSPGAASD